MAFIIEFFISKVLSVLIYKSIGWNEKGYDQLIHTNNKYIFNNYNKWFAFFKYLVFFLFFVSMFFYIFCYFYGLYNNNEYVPTYENGIIVYNVKYSDEMLYVGWMFLLFGVTFFLDLQDQAPLLVHFYKKITKYERKNLIYSFRTPFWVVLPLTALLHVLLLMFIENAWVMMTPADVNATIAVHHASMNLDLALCACYYILVIDACVFVISSIVLYFTHSTIDVKYVSLFCKPDSSAYKFFYDRLNKIKTKINKSIKKIEEVIF